MDEDNGKTGAPRRSFDPDKVEDFLGTGGGLLGELSRHAGIEQDQAENCRWIGKQVGPFRITRYLDRGGMALVFLGQRCDGTFEQSVAIKLLSSPGGTGLAERFSRERHFLARLKHPGIAHIVDAGVVTGQPWIAMELVEGVPIDQYCDEHQLDLVARIRLFVRAARAVQHAHSRLVIHRDLKPSNILVETDGRPKLLDFGIAKALQGDAPELTGQALLLTPLYASPEQVLGDPVGVASDIYQLGLLLYKLLTGCDAQAMDQASIEQIRNVVVEAEPLSPSTLVNTTGRQDARRLEQIAQSRSTSSSRLARKLAGDLDAVVMQALEKEPDHRFVSVDQFVDDLENYCAGRPVRARPATPWYRARKFAQRHRGGVAAAALTLTVLLVSAISLGLSWRTTIRAQQQALEEAAGARQVGDFLSTLLAEANPTVSGGEELTVRELLDAGASRLDALSDQPRVQARLLEVVASAYESLALPDQAEPLARQALDLRSAQSDPSALVEPLAVLAMVNLQQGELDRALDFGQQAVQVSGSSGVDPVIRSMAHQALAGVLFQHGEYEEQRIQLLAGLQALDPVSGAESVRRRAHLLMRLGSNSRQTGDYSQALTEFESALVLLGDAPDQRVSRMFTLRELGTLHSNLGNEDRAVDMLQQSLDLARRLYGDDSANILGGLVLLGRSLGNVNRTDEAAALFDQALAVAEGTIGKEHGNYARILHDYAEILRRVGRFNQVREMRAEATRVARSYFGNEHSTAVNLRKAEAFLALDEGRYPAAVESLGAVLPAVSASFGEQHMITFETAAGHAEALLESGRLAEAKAAMLSLQQQGLQIAEGRFPGYQRNLSQLARVHLIAGELEGAVEFADEAVSRRMATAGDTGLPMVKPLANRALIRLAGRDPRAQDDLDQVESLLRLVSSPSTVPMNWFLSDTALTLALAGRPDAARDLCEKSLSELESALTTGQPILAYARASCAEVAIRAGAPDQARDLLEAAVSVIADTLGEDHWRALWAAARLAALKQQPEVHYAALARLKSVLGEDNPLLALLLN